MSDLSLVISLVALFVSACGLGVSALGYVRDRSRLIAWSTSVWHRSGPYHDPKEMPVLHVLVLNAGRRPIMVRSLVKKAGRAVWWQSVKEPAIDPGAQEDVAAYLDEVQRNAVAHISAIRLNEGEIFEMVFQTNDCPSFIATHTTQPVEADSLLIEDVQGKRYRVRDSQKHLKTLFSAWRPGDA